MGGRVSFDEHMDGTTSTTKQQTTPHTTYANDKLCANTYNKRKLAAKRGKNHFFSKKSSFGHPEKPHRSSVIFTTFVSKIDLFLSKSCLVIHSNPINYATTMFKKTSFLPQKIAKKYMSANFKI